MATAMDTATYRRAMDKETFFSWRTAVVIGSVISAWVIFAATDLYIFVLIHIVMIVFVVAGAIKNGRSCERPFSHYGHLALGLFSRVARVVSLSRLKHGFESRTGHFLPSPIDAPSNNQVWRHVLMRLASPIVRR